MLKIHNALLRMERRSAQMSACYMNRAYLPRNGQVSAGMMLTTSTNPHKAQYMMVPLRFYAKEPPLPSPPTLPNKEQLMKYFFRVVAFLWDMGVWLLAWTKVNFEKHVIKNGTVQSYYKNFINKMEEAKKN